MTLEENGLIGGIRMMGIGMMVFLFLTLFAIFVLEKYAKLIDRYRLKYGFDREIEGKIFGTDTEKMDAREKRFKKRVFKD